jgi:hypothetical protein
MTNSKIFNNVSKSSLSVGGGGGAGSPIQRLKCLPTKNFVGGGGGAGG